MSGYYAYNINLTNKNKHGAWIAQLSVDTLLVTNTQGHTDNNDFAPLIFPNPAQDIFNVDINLTRPEYLSFELYDVNGKLIELLLKDWVKTKTNTFSFSLKDVSSGIYLLKITGSTTNLTKKIIKQ